MTFTLSRYDDVVGLFRDLDRWSGDWGQVPIYVKEGGLKSDSPEHTISRRLVTGASTARRTEGFVMWGPRTVPVAGDPRA